MTDQPRYACKNMLIRPGHFASLPLWAMMATGVGWNEKGVYAVLLNHLRGAASTVFLTIGRIAAEAAMAPRTVQRSLARLQEVEWIEKAGRRGSATCYRLLMTAEARALLETETHANLAHNPRQIGTGSAPNWHHTDATVAHRNTQAQRKEASARGGLFSDAMEARWASAYRLALGVPMPTEWRSWLRGQRGGVQVAMAAGVDWRAIREAHQLARRHRSEWTPELLLGYVLERRQAAHYESLPAEQQAEYLALARRQCERIPPKHRDQVVRNVARGLAWEGGQGRAPDEDA